MLKTQFRDKTEVDLYIAEQKIRQEKGYLTCSERETLKKLIDKPNDFIMPEKEELKKFHTPIVRDINVLRIPCKEVAEKEDVKTIIQDLKETLAAVGGLGLTANQIGYDKRISYCKLPYVTKEGKVDVKEMILINPKIIEKDSRFISPKEGCLSLPGIRVDTDRYIFITVTYLDENFKKQMRQMQDLEGIIIQHEVDHQNGITILDRKHKAR